MPQNNTLLKRLFGIGYFFALFFVVIGIRLTAAFNFRVAHGYNLDVFSRISYLGENYNTLSVLSRFDGVMNIIMFLFFPFACRALVPSFRLYKIIITGVCSSVCIEVLQYFFDVGLADINDVVANSLGVVIGSGLIFIWSKR